MIKKIKNAERDGERYIKILKERAQEVGEEAKKAVEEILSKIKEKGNEAVLAYTRQFDAPSIQDFRVTRKEIEDAYKQVDKEFIVALTLAKENIQVFHEKQKQNGWMMNKEKGIVLGQMVRPLQRVGIYVPGGTAAYPSSVLMNAIPAKVAGVQEIVMTTPPSKDGLINPNILVAADIAGVKEIYKVGGAQAIGALAYGTESIEAVDKIVGPGNIYVALAKRSVYGQVDIDMIAGPSEILVLADEKANPTFLAADLLSQAEHDPLASSILITTSEEVAQMVEKELVRQMEELERKEIIKTSLENYGLLLVVKELQEAVRLANQIAPEHLELMVREPFAVLSEIKNAGSIFLGEYAPEPLGDYMAGPNHVLPTSGTAKFFSPLSVDDFIKKSSYLYYTKEALEEVKAPIIKLAETEGLTAHGNAIKVRFLP